MVLEKTLRVRNTEAPGLRIPDAAHASASAATAGHHMCSVPLSTTSLRVYHRSVKLVAPPDLDAMAVAFTRPRIPRRSTVVGAHVRRKHWNTRWLPTVTVTARGAPSMRRSEREELVFDARRSESTPIMDSMLSGTRGPSRSTTAMSCASTSIVLWGQEHLFSCVFRVGEEERAPGQVLQLCPTEFLNWPLLHATQRP
jgi:hypothetical protein